MSRSFVLRVDFDARPWRFEDQMFTAMSLRLLESARAEGWLIHGFVSLPTLKFYPALADALLNDGHALDWLPLDSTETLESATAAFSKFGVPATVFTSGHEVHSSDSSWVRRYLMTEVQWTDALVRADVEPLVWRVTPQDLGEIDPDLRTVSVLVRRLIQDGRRMVTLSGPGS